jgi:hypothetical protein
MTRIAKLGEGVLLLLTHCRVDCEAAAEGVSHQEDEAVGMGRVPEVSVLMVNDLE